MLEVLARRDVRVTFFVTGEHVRQRPEAEVSGFRGNTVAVLDAVIDHFAGRGRVFTDPAGVPL